MSTATPGGDLEQLGEDGGVAAERIRACASVGDDQRIAAPPAAEPDRYRGEAPWPGPCAGNLQAAPAEIGLVSSARWPGRIQTAF